MCCFSRAVETVGETRIFARFTGEHRQAVVYQMRYKANEPLAMILPLPTSANAAEDAVKFINLEKYPAFFDDLKLGFPVPKPRATFGGDLSNGPIKSPKLVVHEVGSFVASFVPKVADFERLDERFRLPASTWEKLPAYRDYGFAVFQLKPDAQKTHPMAFDFPTRPRAGVFFPTVHIHDGKVHDVAGFDHDLYLQLRDEMAKPPRGWSESDGPAAGFVKIDKTEKLVAGDLHCYRQQLRGKLRNQDTWVV